MRYSVAIGLLLTLAGCGGDVSNSPTSDSATPAEAVSAGPPTSTVATSGHSSKSAVAAKAEEKFEFKPLALDGVVGSPTDATGTSAKPDPEKQIQAVIAKLQPLQILLGQWRGTTRRDY